jgi:crotonobetaine/carnitine-CoA ligase
MQQIVEAAGYRASDMVYLPFPLYHILGQSHLVGALRNNCQLALAERFSASRFWRDVSRCSATVLVHQGASIPILLEQPPTPEERDHVARVSLGAGVPNSTVWKAFEERFGVPILEYYASTEGAFFGGGTVPTRRAGSVGPAYPTAEVRLVDEGDNEVPVDHAGELLCRLRGPYARKRPEDLYYNEPAHSRERFTPDGWFRTGDLLRRDGAGFYYYVGKVETLIRCRGENVSPVEVENVVNQYPAIQESVAVGIPNMAMGGEEVKVVVALRPGATWNPTELVAWCDARLAYFKVPRYLEVQEGELQKTENTKRPLRRLYREQGVTARTWDRLRAGVQLERERQRVATGADSSRSAS